MRLVYIIKINYKLQVSEMEDFGETHRSKLCVILRSRVPLGVCVLIKDIGQRQYP